MTNKQKKVAEKLVGSGGSLTISEAMRQAGYSENTIDTPTKLTESKGWQELMDTYLPDNDILEVHKAGLKATKIFSSHTEPDKEVPDHTTRLKAVELAYKIKKKTDAAVNVQVNVTPILSELKAE